MVRGGASAKAPAEHRRPLSRGRGATALRAWSGAVGRTSLAVERLLRRS
jgi:hypothetical protein